MAKKNLNIFTERIKDNDTVKQTDWKREILDSIAATGTVTAEVKHIINGNMDSVLNRSSGAARLQTNVIKKFDLILGQPELLDYLSSFQIRCCLCNRVISYPVWYYKLKCAVNHFHYFICFDPASPTKPSINCYRR